MTRTDARDLTRFVAALAFWLVGMPAIALAVAYLFVWAGNSMWPTPF